MEERTLGDGPWRMTVRHSTGRLVALAILPFVLQPSSEAQAASERRCEAMTRQIARLQERGDDARAAQMRRMYQGVCPGSSAPTAAPAQPAPRDTEAPPPSSSPSPSADAAKTKGYFVDWDRALNARCDTGTTAGRTQCAQMKIDQAVAEQRLSAAEVQSCQPTGASRSGPSSSAQGERQARRVGSLGGDAYWKWSGHGGCKLEDRVKQTFAAVAPTPPPRSPGTPALPCAAAPTQPECRATSELPATKSYSAFDRAAYSRCVRDSNPSQNRPRDFCAQSVVQQAVGAGVLSNGAVEACRTQWQQNPQGELENMSIYLCLQRAAALEEAGTSTIVRSTPRTGFQPALRTDGHQRGPLMAAIYDGDVAKMPGLGGDDAIYLPNALGQLWEECRDPKILQAQMRMIEQAQQRDREAMVRAARGQGSREDAQVVVAALAIGIAAMEDCEAKEDFDDRQRCQRNKDQMMTLPDSPQAVSDIKLLVKRHACGSAEVNRFTNNLVSWLLKSPEQRSPMAWAAGKPQAAQYNAMFDNCRRQSGEGSADAWCGCYVRQFSTTRGGTRAHPSDVMATAHKSAFVGESWFAPEDLSACDELRKQITSWRYVRNSSQVATACLVGQTSVAGSIAPALKACRYRTAWGEIEVRTSQCRPQLLSQLWGDQQASCN